MSHQRRSSTTTTTTTMMATMVSHHSKQRRKSMLQLFDEMKAVWKKMNSVKGVSQTLKRKMTAFKHKNLANTNTAKRVDDDDKSIDFPYLEEHVPLDQVAERYILTEPISFAFQMDQVSDDAWPQFVETTKKRIKTTEEALTSDYGEYLNLNTAFDTLLELDRTMLIALLDCGMADDGAVAAEFTSLSAKQRKVLMQFLTLKVPCVIGEITGRTYLQKVLTTPTAAAADIVGGIAAVGILGESLTLKENSNNNNNKAGGDDKKKKRKRMKKNNLKTNKKKN